MSEKTRVLSFAFLLLGIALLSSCATEPVTGRRQLIAPVVPKEISQSQEAWSSIRKRTPLSPYAELDALVQKTGRNLLLHNDVNSLCSWSFTLLHSKHANAFSLPDGHVAIHDQLFAYINNEAELATVIAHEMAHIIAKHGAERMTHDFMVNMGQTLLTTALSQTRNNQADLWLAAYTGTTRLGFILPFSRQHEYSADYIAIIMMAHAGYDPNAAADFWARMAKNNKQTYYFNSTHPSNEARAKALQKYMYEAMSIYQVSRKRGKGTTLHH